MQAVARLFAPFQPRNATRAGVESRPGRWKTTIRRVGLVPDNTCSRTVQEPGSSSPPRRRGRSNEVACSPPRGLQWPRRPGSSRDRHPGRNDRANPASGGVMAPRKTSPLRRSRPDEGGGRVGRRRRADTGTIRRTCVQRTTDPMRPDRYAAATSFHGWAVRTSRERRNRLGRTLASATTCGRGVSRRGREDTRKETWAWTRRRPRAIEPQRGGGALDGGAWGSGETTTSTRRYLLPAVHRRVPQMHFAEARAPAGVMASRQLQTA